jgi:hypothetical protein
MFEEAENALEEAVKMLNSPERAALANAAPGIEQPTTPGTPAYSDFLHEFGSEDGMEGEDVIVQRRP